MPTTTDPRVARYQERIDAMSDADLVTAFEGEARRLATATMGSDVWEAALVTVPLVRKALLDRLARVPQLPYAAPLPYGLELGQHLTDGEGLWRVDAEGLTDLAGDCDWTWEEVAANGGLGILHPPGSAENYREPIH